MMATRSLRRIEARLPRMAKSRLALLVTACVDSCGDKAWCSMFLKPVLPSVPLTSSRLPVNRWSRTYTPSCSMAVNRCSTRSSGISDGKPLAPVGTTTAAAPFCTALIAWATLAASNVTSVTSDLMAKNRLPALPSVK